MKNAKKKIEASTTWSRAREATKKRWGICGGAFVSGCVRDAVLTSSRVANLPHSDVLGQSILYFSHKQSRSDAEWREKKRKKKRERIWCQTHTQGSRRRHKRYFSNWNETKMSFVAFGYSHLVCVSVCCLWALTSVPTRTRRRHTIFVAVLCIYEH